jgi:hypothetical protein
VSGPLPGEAPAPERRSCEEIRELLDGINELVRAGFVLDAVSPGGEAAPARRPMAAPRRKRPQKCS